MRVRTGVLAVVLIVAGAWAQDDPDVADWAGSIKLFCFGGPSRADIELSVNGEFVAEFAESAPPEAEISDLLLEGVNELTILLKSPEEPRETGNRLKIQVAGMHQVSATQMQMEQPLVAEMVPAEFAPEDTCTEVRRFWAGPERKPDPQVKKRFWFFAQGPPVHHSVTVLINGVPVTTVRKGSQLFEVTSFLVKGRNTIVFEGTPTCIREPSGQTGPLTLGVARGQLEHEVVRMPEMPLALFEVAKKKKPEPFSKKMSFRAW